MWVGVGHVGPHLGLEHFANSRWSTFSALSFDGSAHEITALFRDRDGCLWVGTERSGIYRINGSQVDTFNRADGLSSNNITGFQQDSEGDVWVTTAGGLDVFRKRPVVLSITHKLSSKDEAELDIGEAGHSSPHDGVSWRWILGACEVASESGKFSEI